MSSGARRRPPWVVGLVVWAVAGCILFAIVWGLDGGDRHLFRALRSSRMTVGTLVGKDTADHDSFEYSYVDSRGRRHTGGRGGEGQEQGDPADLTVGTELTVWYSTADPAISCYCTPSENSILGLYVQELVISQFLAVGAGVGTATVGLRRARRRWPRVSPTSRTGAPPAVPCRECPGTTGCRCRTAR